MTRRFVGFQFAMVCLQELPYETEFGYQIGLEDSVRESSKPHILDLRIKRQRKDVRLAA